jgi:3-deoxy-manno-octulosonate cytidylyltransferase (CMP-KDO synthetase)
MIEHVFRRVQCAKGINEIYVATCDEEIADQVKKFGGKSIMTSASHTRGTDRVAEAARKIDSDIIINVQGDEPTVDPSTLDAAISYFREKSGIKCLNLTAPIQEWRVFTDENVVKTIIDRESKVLYFSRQPIPTQMQKDFRGALKQIGIYLIDKDLLRKFSRWRESPLEMTERVDMLRILENGFSIHAFRSKDMISVDTYEDLSAVERALAHDPLYHQLFKIEDWR